MPRYGDQVGLRFHQKASGRLAPLPGAPPAPPRFALDLTLEADSLRRFLEGARHEAPARGGTVWWGGHPYPVASGRMELFRPDRTDPRRKTYDLDFRFTGPGGRACLFFAQKVLRDDGWADLFDAAGDLSRLEHVTVSDAGTGRALYTGTLHVHLDEVLAELASLEVLGAGDAREREAARSAFSAFFNRELAAIYSGLPLLIGESSPLSWPEQVAVQLLADALLPADRAIGPVEVLRGVERFVETAQAPALERARPALALAGQALGLLRPAREWLRQRCEEALRGPPGPLREAVELAHALVVVPYYAHPRVDAQVGYARFRIPEPRPTLPPLPEVEAPQGAYDFLIAGSGPAGALLADRLTAAGRTVLLLEAGAQHPASTLTSDELDAVARLYRHGGLQRAEDPGVPRATTRSFPVLQGEGVGGGALVNNAVCFQLPPDVETHWRERLAFPVSHAALAAAYAAVAEDLGIVPLSRALAQGAVPNPAWRYLQPALGPALHECHVNLQQCVGCGLCNLGCALERKRNALTVHLPRAAATGRLHLLTRARLEQLVPGPGGRVTHAQVHLKAHGEVRRVVAKHYVLACGAIGTPLVLHRTPGLEDRARRLVGRRLSANVGAAVHGFVQQRVDAARSLALAHYHRPPGPGTGYVVETWFNPPASHALAMPGFLDVHAARMRRYAHLVSAGALIGVTPRGTVHPDGRVELPLDVAELGRLRDGVVAIARALLHPGTPARVEEVLLPTREGVSLRTRAEVEAFARAFDDVRELTVGTGHPQGGSAMSDDPALGVVDRNFRVRGLENAYVCDASLFPGCAHVNPQWTLLALAHLAGRTLAALG